MRVVSLTFSARADRQTLPTFTHEKVRVNKAVFSYCSGLICVAVGFPNGKSVIESNFQQLRIAPVESQWRGIAKMLIPFRYTWNEKGRNESGCVLSNRPGC